MAQVVQIGEGNIVLCKICVYICLQGVVGSVLARMKVGSVLARMWPTRRKIPNICPASCLVGSVVGEALLVSLRDINTPTSASHDASGKFAEKCHIRERCVAFAGAEGSYTILSLVW